MTQGNPYAPPKAPIAPEPDVPADELANRSDRLFASIVDSVLLLIPSMSVGFATGYWGRVTTGDLRFMDQISMVFVGVLSYTILNGYHLNYHGQTLGKRMFGIRIVSLENNAVLPLWKILALRVVPLWLVSAIPALGSLAGFVDPLFIFRRDKRCVHDFIANTKVVPASVPWKHANGKPAIS